MAKRGEIAVELRLSDKKLKADIAAAMSKLKQDVAKMTVTSSGGSLTMGRDIEKSSSAIDKQAAKVKNLTNALKDNKKAQLDAWRAANPGGIAQGQKITFADQPGKNSGKFSKWYAGQIVPNTGGGLATTPSMGIPIPPIIPPPKIPSASQQKSHLDMAVPFIERRLGLYGIAPALKAVGILGIAAVGVGVAFVAMKKAMQEFTAATENARRLYAKNVSSGGLGQGFVTQRSLLSRVIGISEEEVMQYAGTFGYLNSRLSIANRILVETNPTLTATAFNFEILKIDIESLSASLANDAAPAINLVVTAIDGLVKTVELFSDSKIGKLIFGGMAKTLLGMVIPPSLVETLSKMGITELNGGAGSAPSIGSNPNRMPISSWEKMGLVIGQMGGKNPQEETAKNTKKLVQLFEKLTGGQLTRTGMPSFDNPIPSQP